MTAQGPSGPARPTRLAGFVLIGLAAVAVGLGVFSLASNGSPQAGHAAAETTTTTKAPPPPASHPSSTGRPSTPPTSTGTTTTSATTSGATPPSGAPSTTTAPPPTSGGAVPAASPITIRVYNNSFIKDLAQQAAGDFRNAGFTVVQVGNYPQGVIPTTTAYFNPTAPGEQQVAEQLGQDFGMKVEPRFPGIALSSPGVIVIVTKDFKGPQGK